MTIWLAVTFTARPFVFVEVESRDVGKKFLQDLGFVPHTNPDLEGYFIWYPPGWDKSKGENFGRVIVGRIEEPISPENAVKEIQEMMVLNSPKQSAK